MDNDDEYSLGPFPEILGDGLSSAVNSSHFIANRKCPSISEVEELLISKGRVYHCAYCKYGTARRKKIKNHIIFNHIKFVTKNDFSYAIFDKVKPTSPHLLPKKIIKNLERSTYQAKYNALRKFHCPHCYYKAASNVNLKKHVLAVHLKSKPISCPHCDFRTVENINLKRHIQAMHTNVKDAVCPYCDYRGLHIGNLKQHIMLKHTNEGLLCPYCNLRTTHTAHMKRHITLVHLKDKRFVCTKCEYRAGRIGHLQRHILSKHMNEKQHPCPHCDYRFVNKSDLRNHIASKHSCFKFFICPFCHYRGPTNRHLKCH